MRERSGEGIKPATRLDLPRVHPYVVIDTATNTVVTDYRVLNSIAVTITPDESRTYATNAGSGFNNVPPGASVIDTAPNAVLTNTPIPVTGPPIAIAITPAPQAPRSKEECKLSKSAHHLG